MKPNYTWKASLFIATATIGVLGAAPTQPESEPETVKLFARESSVSVLGRTAKVAALTQSHGEQGYSRERTRGLHVEGVNELPVRTPIHWHALILRSLMYG